MGNYIIRNKILELLIDKTKYKGLKLPSYVDFNIDNKVLFIALGKHDSKNGIVFSCTANMQTDEAAFEGWSICLKHHLPDFIDSVVLSWEKPNQMTSSQQLHYNRFSYRVIRFRQMFDWFSISNLNKKELIDFENELTKLDINTSLNHASKPSDRSSKEKQIEYNQQNLDFIKKRFHLQNVSHQLPVGIKKEGRSFSTDRASAIDIWGIDQQGNLNIFELKFKNKKAGIISELLFYSEVMYDLFVSKQIRMPAKIKNIRGAEYLYGNTALLIKAIKSYFLFDKLHPLVIGTTALLNSNNFGIKFFNTQYKLKKESYLFESLYFKGAFQTEVELKQYAFRNLNGLNGYSYILNNGDENLHKSIREEAKAYFKDNNIDWWTFNNSKTSPTGHLVSSQIQCMNYLFALRKDKEIVLKLAQLFAPEIDDVLPTMTDTDSGYIAFEFIYENAKMLNENYSAAKRGSFCTSIDAFIIAKRKGEKVLIPVEWKYTESYFDALNKALEPGKGKTRQNSYNQLIENSTQLKSYPDVANSAYYYEPFYELMRQTLLVEQMVKSGIASDFLHVLVVPEENKDLLDNNYAFSKNNLKTTWSNCLTDKSKFIIVDSKLILEIIKNATGYSKLADYLGSRY